MARKDTKLDHLGRVPMFSSLNKKELQTVGRASDEIHVKSGKVLAQEGSAGHEFFVILGGSASVKYGRRKVNTLGPGKSFGELSLLDRGPRNATITAETDMDLLVLGQREFSGILDEVPAVAHKLLVYMAGRLRDSDKKAFSH